MPPTTTRPLDELQLFMWNTAKADGAGNVSTSVCLDPPAEYAAVREAAMAVQARHPVLQSVVRCKGRGRPYFEIGACTTVEVREYSGDDSSVLERELNDSPTGFERGWRLAICGPRLVLTYSHCFLDGLSAMYIMQELLAALSGVALPAADTAVPVPPWGVWSAAGAGKALTPCRAELLCKAEAEAEDGALLDGDAGPEQLEPAILEGTWLPSRPGAWWAPALARSKRTVHHWGCDNRCEWTTGPFKGTSRIVGRRAAVRDRAVYDVHYYNKTNGNDMYGIITILGENEYLLTLNVFPFGGEFMKRVEGKGKTQDSSLPSGLAEDPEPPVMAQVPAVEPAHAILVSTSFHSCWEGIFSRKPCSRNQWQIWKFSCEQTARLRERCAAEGTTVQGALAAALARAMGGRGRSDIKIISAAVQVRDEYGVGPRALGCYFSNFAVLVDAGLPFWDVARDYVVGLHAGKAARHHMKAFWGDPNVDCFNWILNKATGTVIGAIVRCMNLYNGNPPSRAQLSNRGAFTVGTARHKVTEFDVVQLTLDMEFDALWINACTVDGALHLTIAWKKRWFSTDRECAKMVRQFLGVVESCML